MLSHWYRSTSFWLVCNIVVLTLASAYTLEFTSVGFDITSQSDRLDILDKIDQFKATKDNTVLMLGSSLGIFPAALADYKTFGEPKPGADKFLNYCSYRYLDQLLDKNSKPTETLNLSYQGGMVSEDLLILRGCLKANLVPEMVILLSGPRDFIDHQTNKPGDSKLSKALMVRITGSQWNLDLSAANNLEILGIRYFQIFAQRDAIRKYLATALQRTRAMLEHRPFVSKPAPTGGSLERIKDEPGSAEMMEFYTANYKLRYLPVDWIRWKIEMDALYMFIELCRERNIPLLLVEMPLSKSNRELLPEQFVIEHRKKLAQLVGQSKRTAILDLFADLRFKTDDYMDTVHLRSTGGIKLAKLISAKITSYGWLK